MRKRSQIVAIVLIAFLSPIAAVAQLDSANTWVSTALPGGPHTVHSVILDPERPDTVFAGTTPGSIYRSLNTTHTWAEIADAGTTINQDVRGIGFNPLNPDVMYAGSPQYGSLQVRR
jgi:hypothetical protein